MQSGNLSRIAANLDRQSKKEIALTSGGGIPRMADAPRGFCCMMMVFVSATHLDFVRIDANVQSRRSSRRWPVSQ
jgi:hypothetical protein